MRYIFILLLLPVLCFGQAPDLYKLVYDSMELTTGGPSVTKSTTLRKDQDYKVILLEVPKGHNGYDVVISFKEKVIVSPEVFIDNNPNETINSQLVNTYTPGSPTWTHTTVAGHHNNTISFSGVANSSLVTKFTGTKIVWIGEKDKHLGKVAVSIDNGPETIVDQYNATNLKQQALFTKEVTAGLHTIKLRLTGEKNAASSGIYCVHDAFKVTP